MRELIRDGTTEPVKRDQTLRGEGGQRKLIFPSQQTSRRIDDNLDPVDPNSAESTGNTDILWLDRSKQLIHYLLLIVGLCPVASLYLPSGGSRHLPPSGHSFVRAYACSCIWLLLCYGM